MYYYFQTSSPYLSYLHSHISPIVNKHAPIKNNHHEIGSSKTINTPIPNPIKQTPIVFLKQLSKFFYLLPRTLFNITI